MTSFTVSNKSHITQLNTAFVILKNKLLPIFRKWEQALFIAVSKYITMMFDKLRKLLGYLIEQFKQNV